MPPQPAPPPRPTLATATAPGKVILVGEHAVVHGQPAIALPLPAVAAQATIRPSARGFVIAARDLDREHALEDALASDVLAAAVRASLEYLAIAPPRWRLEVASTVPLCAGLGSSASVAVATVRAVTRAAGAEADPSVLCRLAWDAERVIHGNSSGIDPTVVALERPIWYRAGVATSLTVAGRFDLIVADSGEPGDTAAAVAGVAAAMAASPAEFGALVERVGALASAAARCLTEGDRPGLGRVLDQNHAVLQAMLVSTSTLDRLVAAARAAGALGAKLTGAGGGGSVVALAAEHESSTVGAALLRAGARAVFQLTLQPDTAVLPT